MASVRANRVIDNWATIIEGGSGRGENLYDAIHESLKEIPDIEWNMQQVSTGLLGGTCEFMVIKQDQLREYTIYLFARDFGSHLKCGWFMTVEPGVFKRTYSKQISGNPLALSQNLDIFAQEDLQAWKYVVHRAFIKHAREIMDELKQDTTNMNTQSKGFLSVW